MTANDDDVALLNEILIEYGESPYEELPDGRSTPTPSGASSPTTSDSVSAVDLVLAPPSDLSHVIHVNRQSVCSFDIKVPKATKLPEVFAFRISTAAEVGAAERILGYGFKVSVNHVSNNTEVVDGDVELKAGEMTLEEEILETTYHSPKFSKGEEGVGELSPFQAMIDLPISSDNWASPASKDTPPTTIKIVIDNSKSVFRPRRLTFQYAFFSKKIRDTAVGAAGEMRQKEMEERTKQWQGVKENGGLGLKILGGLVVGGVVTGGGIGALAGGMVVVGGMKAVEKMKAGGGSGGEEMEERAEREEKINQLEERLSQQTKLKEVEKEEWEEQRVMLLGGMENLKLQLKKSKEECVELESKFREERSKGEARERELVGSVVELEGVVRRLKREKKVLIVEVKKLQAEKSKVKLELGVELDQAKMNYRAAKGEVRRLVGGGRGGGGGGDGDGDGGEVEDEGEKEEKEKLNAQLQTLKSKRAQLLGVKAKQPSNVTLDGLIGDIENAISDLERRIGGGGGGRGGSINFVS